MIRIGIHVAMLLIWVQQCWRGRQKRESLHAETIPSRWQRDALCDTYDFAGISCLAVFTKLKVLTVDISSLADCPIRLTIGCRPPVISNVLPESFEKLELIEKWWGKEVERMQNAALRQQKVRLFEAWMERLFQDLAFECQAGAFPFLRHMTFRPYPKFESSGSFRRSSGLDALRQMFRASGIKFVGEYHDGYNHVLGPYENDNWEGDEE
ncbi:hypothetical protein BKA67DRAFT_566179 [Truncatella angustata]|uniref:Uncharacterized protein n=1 Tax=Truncatella angustata TaxID=152316 RepID=A0A9P8ZXF0_9PEZI|nr:uncharacterized protein BKA67DRAFT_566179 [Truncatella angustata]KAH6654767.1 hypothetical protein BKA67DRAFT_566179 [Truncatella angustata]